jgi:hypothetical protein
MAFAAVQAPTKTFLSGTSKILTISSSGIYGLLIVHVNILVGLSETITSITDNKGNTYVISSALTQPDSRCYLAYTVDLVGGVTSITVNFSSSVTAVFGVNEFSGGKKTNATVIDGSTSGQSSGYTSNASVPSFTPSADGNLIVCLLCSGDGRTITPGAGYTQYSSEAFQALYSMYKLSSSGSETGPATYSDTTQWSEFLFSFNPEPIYPPIGKIINLNQAVKRASSY